MVLNRSRRQGLNVAEKAVMCAGFVNYDVVLHTESVPEPDHSSPVTEAHTASGGSATNTALALSSFDVDVSMLGRVGNDEHGKAVSDGLADSGVEPLLEFTDKPTSIIYALITDGADPRYLNRGATFGDIGLETVADERWESFDHVHLTSFDDEIGGEIATRAVEDGKTVSFNPSQGYANAEFDKIVDAAAVIFLNEREANLFRSRHDFEEVVKDAIVVMTHGAAGSTAYTPHGVVTHSGYGSGEVADTIGAGDAFVAGFLSEWVGDEDYPDIEQALSTANAAGAYTVTRVGAPNDIDTEWIAETVEE